MTNKSHVSMLLCPCCGEGSSIALETRIDPQTRTLKKSLPDRMLDREPCKDCQNQFNDYKTKGFTLFIINDSYEDAMQRFESKSSYEKKKLLPPTPWQFFSGLVVMKNEAANKIFQDFDMSHGAAFIPISLANKLGIEKPTQSLKD